MRVADAIAPADLARYQPYNEDGSSILLFDAILVDASEPATIALNRFYTQDFYRDIRHILSPDGFLYTAISASEDLQGETAFLSASIAKTLRNVFDRVLVTYGTENQFFAGAIHAPITLVRATLFQRSAGADLKTRYFRPEYFLNADEISPEKLDFVERRLAAIPVAANTCLKPVSTFYQIALWSRFSGSDLESLLAWMTRLRPGWVTGVLLGFGVICLGVGALLGRRLGGAKQGCVILPHERRVRAHGLHKITEIVGPVPSPGAGGSAARPCARMGEALRRSLVAPWTLASSVEPRSGAVFSRSMLVLVMAATGLCGMALELILIFIFQALLGYVYSKIGLIVAMFMLGLTLGAFGAPRLIRRGARLQWRAMVVMEILLIVEASCIPWLMTALSSGLMIWIPWGWVEALIYGAIAGSGALVGAQFALVSELMSHLVLVQNDDFGTQRSVDNIALSSSWRLTRPHPLPGERTEERGHIDQHSPHPNPLPREREYYFGHHCYETVNMQSTISADACSMPVDLAKAKGGTAALTNAADLAGAALGGLVVGVLLLPLFGITATCFLLAILKAASLLCLLAAWRVVGIVASYSTGGK